ncbi:acetyl/propionyl/methylcrotonyl-CoA carboxylase subunit alpha [Zhihengliuella flava]|uniref:biotin carboxylase n=1 Tax=Zhihengliuella flava TaxID=1285193 RepID=A0A931GDV7_9MICC|nr:biotin carboxylase N-terminal domain-containing protein [Zhihengliuella flava]MBG6083838.1 acetyl-CoA/propionyl-CoA carboxylase biotin carboxyl carrier protein [Zhihengliuella flava]
MTDLFETVLVANRGEIAVRIIRTLRRLGIRSIAVYAPDDADALHVRQADEAVGLGDAEHPSAADTYLNIEVILAACRSTGAQAVHPGYGFLSENVEFARALEAAGITFIGPPSESINLMGDKIRSKNHVQAHSVPVVPGIAEPGLSDAQLTEAAESIGYPLLIKPSAGGGGKGMFAVTEPGELPAALASARRTARNAFGDDTLFLERLVTTPRHIEVQVLADGHGRTVHLAERECSLQRRHQKVIEEAPAPLLDGLGRAGEEIRARLGAAAVRAAESVGYRGAGTVEFLVSDEAPDEFFFMEMNTRLQVEHPVTEEVVRVEGRGLDLVEQQVRIAAGQALAFGQDDVRLSGHAVEARVYAEDPAADFLPSAGKAFYVELPQGEGLRVDTAIEGAGTISAGFDPMIAKVIARGAHRAEALDRLDGALAETVILGVATNVEYLRSLIADDDVAAGRLDTNLIARRGAFSSRELTGEELDFAAVVLGTGMLVPDAGAPATAPPPAAGRQGPWQLGDGWRLGEHRRRTYDLDVDGEAVPVTLGESGAARVTVNAGRARLDGDGVSAKLVWDQDSGAAWLASGGRTATVRLLSRRDKLHRHLAQLKRAVAGGDPDLRAPMPGTVVSLSASTGDRVEAGQPIVTVEAMKMEHPALAAVSGIVTVHVAVGDQVPKSHVLASVAPDAGEASATEPASEGA